MPRESELESPIRVGTSDRWYNMATKLSGHVKVKWRTREQHNDALVLQAVLRDR